MAELLTTGVVRFCIHVAASIFYAQSQKEAYAHALDLGNHFSHYRSLVWARLNNGIISDGLSYGI